MSSDTILEANLQELANSVFGPSLETEERIITAGNVMIPAPWWSLLFTGVINSLQTYFLVLTNWRLVLIRNKSLAGRLTYESAIIKKQIDLDSIRSATIKGNAAVLKTSRGTIKLVGIKVAGMPMTHSTLLYDIVNNIQQTNEA